MKTVIAWAIAHPEQLPIALGATAALARVLYAVVSRIVAPYPRLRALVEALAAASPDVIRAAQQLASAVLGRAVPSLDQRAPDDDREALRARVAELEGQLGMQRASAPPRDNPQRGRASLSAMAWALLVVGGVAVAFYTVVVAPGCTPAREAVMRVTPGVPPAVSCTPDTWRCNGTMPEHCSASGRWWPSLSRRADGSQRQCARGCSMNASGVASCIGPIEAEAGL